MTEHLHRAGLRARHMPARAAISAALATALES
jgi:hypothetical protein